MEGRPWLGCGWFGAYFAIAGVGQDPLQYVHTPERYNELLSNNPWLLKAVIGLDNLFIVCYPTVFLLVVPLLWHDTRKRLLLSTAVGLLTLLAILDLVENMHFLTMIAIVENGQTVELSQIEWQVWESLIKFHIGYLGLFLLGFVLPDHSPLERVVCLAFRWVQLPIGLLIYLTPEAIAFPLVMARFAFFVFALISFGIIFRGPKGDSSEQA